MTLLKEVLPAIRATLVLAVFTGLLFPLAITALSKVLFDRQANGSLLFVQSKLIGSELLGQSFSKPEYFHSRPSAAGGGYGGEASGGTNLGPTSKKLLEGDDSFKGIGALVKEYRTENHLAESQKVPADAVCRSASGLDPHVSPANALLQVERVASARKMPPEHLRQFLNKFIEERTIGVFGEPRINVLKLNLALDSEQTQGDRVAKQDKE
jgi:potassium-transporting ATPase KdpC subunit